MKKLLFFMIFLSAAGLVKAGGYQVNLIGVRYVGMGHIGTGLTMDAGSIFFNPGALSLIKDKYSFTGSISGIFSYTQFRSSNAGFTARTDNPLSTPFSVFASAKITDNLSAGIGVYTPFGSSIVWGDNWGGKYLIQDIKLKAVFFQPTVSYKIGDKLGIGAGLVFAYGKVDLHRAIPVTFADGSSGQANLKGHATNWGYNLGISFKPIEALTIGLNYRSKIKMDLKDGDANFTVPSSLSANFPAGNKFDATLPLPATFSGGISYNINDNFLIGAQVDYVRWSAYDSLIFDFKQNTPSLPDSRNPRKYDNTFIFRLGGQYKASDMLTIRLGGYYDETPVKKDYENPETPDGNRIGLSAGLSIYPTERLSIDLSFLFVNQLKRDSEYKPANFKGAYKTYAYIPGIGLSYNF
ncbi:OmpP1/FadL family transporter [Sporocytophaga myxococcoides]|uniref:OmpP1/FadL family transporter n=1 Tax=Sporocytophaga myxococcoides TaxID=153721 RepID=UPI0004022BC4|nr:outer membrane protein transport protein [Sporocytophaga myxococcoides]